MKQGTTVQRDASGIAKFNTKYKTGEQRRQEGKALRVNVPRESQGGFEKRLISCMGSSDIIKRGK
jgi:hypothetical protein